MSTPEYGGLTPDEIDEFWETALSHISDWRTWIATAEGQVRL